MPLPELPELEGPKGDMPWSGVDDHVDSDRDTAWCPPAEREGHPEIRGPLGMDRRYRS